MLIFRLMSLDQGEIIRRDGEADGGGTIGGQSTPGVVIGTGRGLWHVVEPFAVSFFVNDASSPSFVEVAISLEGQTFVLQSGVTPAVLK